MVWCLLKTGTSLYILPTYEWQF